jgi:hypothetical protein
MEIGLPREDPPDQPPASYLEWFHRKTRRELRAGWKAATWSIPIIPILSWKDWCPGCTVSSDDIVAEPIEAALFRPVLTAAFPTLSMDDDVVYLLSKACQPEVVIAVDLRNKKLQGVRKLVAGKTFTDMCIWTTEISRYLNLNMVAGERKDDKQTDKLKEARKEETCTVAYQPAT